MSGEAALFV